MNKTWSRRTTRVQWEKNVVRHPTFANEIWLGQKKSCTRTIALLVLCEQPMRFEYSPVWQFKRSSSSRRFQQTKQRFKTEKRLLFPGVSLDNHLPHASNKGLKSAAAFSTRRRLLACYTGLLWRLHWFALAVTFSHFQQTSNIDAANHEFLTWADRRRIASYPIIPKASLVLRERFCAKFGARRSPPPPTCWERSHVHGREGAEANKKFRQTVVVRRTRFGKCHREKTLQLLSTVPIHKPAHLVHKQQWRKFNHIDLLKILAAGLDQRQSHFLKIHNIQIGSLLSFFH